MADTNNSPQPQTEDFKVYKPAREGTTHLHALPDSYFTPTAADLKAAQATLSSRTKALVDAPLQTRSVREAQDVAKKARWPFTTIRVKFSDRTQLEKTFPSTDKIRSVYAFVRPLLREDVRPIKFILYQTPPKRDLKVSDPKDILLTARTLGTHVPAPLLPEVLDKAVDLPVPPDYDDSTPGSVTSSPSTARKSDAAQIGEKKIPKWLKLGLSKFPAIHLGYRVRIHNDFQEK
ncbi:hypothetical protein EYR38_007825 [Pleurotus pulmonarius]|nr:hypothetical protein EYR38_007825 [Pleurotus pulmonarius]